MILIMNLEPMGKDLSIRARILNDAIPALEIMDIDALNDAILEETDHESMGEETMDEETSLEITAE